MDAFTSLAQRLTTHVCYASIFADALTVEQLQSRCHPVPPEEVRQQIEDMIQRGLLERNGDYVSFPGVMPPGLAATKDRLSRVAEEIVSENARFLGNLTRLPFVRVVGISGSTAYGHPVSLPGKPPDLDLFVIAARSSVHMVRVWAGVVLKLNQWFPWLGLASRRYRPCVNYVTDELFVTTFNKSFFTATDAFNVKILKGEEHYRRFLAANSWIGRYYALPDTSGLATPSKRNVLRSAVNLVCLGVMMLRVFIRTSIRGRPVLHPFRFNFGKGLGYRRLAQAGGGYQSQVFQQFRRAYEQHVGDCADLSEFLFPDTTPTGVRLRGEHHQGAGVLRYNG